MRQRRAGLVAGLLGVEVEAEGLADLQLDAAVLEDADAELRPLQVHQHADRPVEIFLDLADDVVARLVVFMRAMGEIQPEDVGPGLEQRLDLLARRAGGSQGRDDLGLALASHP